MWARAESHETLTSSLVEIARLLDLPQKDEQDQTIVVQAVKRWLQDNHGWLLILDNADEPAIVREFLPTKCNGHILLTTRAQALGGLAQRIEVDTMGHDVGALLLLRRAGLVGHDASLDTATPVDITIAREITKELGGLPLALDQAGTYVEETGCYLAKYLKRYQVQRAKLLKRRGHNSSGYPASVATTWSLSFERVEQHAAAADLLRFCVFLAPDAIPEEIITKGAFYLGEHLQAVKEDEGLLDEAIGVLRAYSLVHRDPAEKTVSIHRLVRAVLRDAMTARRTRLWAKRTVRAVNAAFPKVEFAQWLACERCLPHAQACCGLIAQDQMNSPEMADLLAKMGGYSQERGQYHNAEDPLRQALTLREHRLGSEHLSVANSLYNLAELYYNQGKYEQAKPLYQRALAIYELQVGLEHPEVAASLRGLGNLYCMQGLYRQAEPLLVRSLEIREHTLEPKHPEVAASLQSLGRLYLWQGKYTQAEALSLRALDIREKALGPHHPLVASSLQGLSNLYHAQCKYEEAELCGKRALGIREKVLGPDHPSVAFSLNDLGETYYDQGKFEHAEPMFQRSLTIKEQQLGLEHRLTANSLYNLAELYKNQGKFEQAEPLLKHALAIYEKTLEPQHSNTQLARQNYAALLRAMGRHEEAKQLEKEQ